MYPSIAGYLIVEILGYQSDLVYLDIQCLHAYVLLCTKCLIRALRRKGFVLTLSDTLHNESPYRDPSYPGGLRTSPQLPKFGTYKFVGSRAPPQPPGPSGFWGSWPLSSFQGAPWSITQLQLDRILRQVRNPEEVKLPNGWWKKSTTGWMVFEPHVNHGINYLPTEFLDFFHQQYVYINVNTVPCIYYGIDLFKTLSASTSTSGCLSHSEEHAIHWVSFPSREISHYWTLSKPFQTQNNTLM